MTSNSHRSYRRREIPTFTKVAMAQEKQIFDARQNAYKTQTQALEQLHSYLEKEVTSLEGQIKNHDTEVNLVSQELDTVRALVSKGLTTQPRRLGLERNLAQAEGDKLRLESALMRVKQDISKTDIDILHCAIKRTDDVTVELASVGNRLEEIGRKLETAEKLIYEFGGHCPKVPRRPSIECNLSIPSCAGTAERPRSLSRAKRPPSSRATR